MLRVLALLFALTLVAASCVSDDTEPVAAATAPDDDAMDDDARSVTEEMADEEAMSDDAMSDEETP